MRLIDGRPARGNASAFKGVCRSRDGKRWDAWFSPDKNRTFRIGTFATEEEAAVAYDAAALKYRGNKAFLNSRDWEAKIQPVVEGSIARVPLTRGRSFIIDVEDLEQVRPYYWAGRYDIKGCQPGKRTRLHHLLLGALPPKHIVIHVNGDNLDFRRPNLAVVPSALGTLRNPKKRTPSSSIYKGVRRTVSNRWETRIAQSYVGTFDTQEEAARAYDEAARRKWGIFASFNFPREGEISCLRDMPSVPAAA